MIRTPIAPRVHEEVTHLLVRHFEATPQQAAQLATRLIKTLRVYDLDIIRGNWMELEPAQPKEMTWESLAQGADELVKERAGIKPWNPPELQ